MSVVGAHVQAFLRRMSDRKRLRMGVVCMSFLRNVIYMVNGT